jgi:hypothetical protein
MQTGQFAEFMFINTLAENNKLNYKINYQQ